MAPLLGPPAPSSFQGLVTALINALAADEALLNLDDYHLIGSQPVHESVAFLLEHRPAGMRVVLASRGGRAAPARGIGPAGWVAPACRPNSPARWHSCRDGYRAHVAADVETGIITDEKLTQASGEENSDAAVAAEFVAAEGAAAGGHGDHDDASGGRLAWYGDSAYGTGDLRAAVATAGDQAVIKPGPLLPAVEGGFTTDDFTVDTAAGTVTCPAGITRHLTAGNAVIFGAACRTCPLRQRCTTAKGGRTLRLHEHDGLLRAARAAWAAGPGLRQDYMAHRPHVERAIAQVAPGADAASSSATAE